MKSFKFQQFEIQQSKNVFRVGTDGVLLGAICDVSGAKQVLEIGTGTGLISLMLAQRNPEAHIFAIDINPEAAILAKDNFAKSPFSRRLKADCADFKSFKNDEKFDALVCNPPYFEPNNSVKDVLARQNVELNFSDLIEKTAALLSENGVFSVIIPSESSAFFIELSEKHKLFLKRKINIFGIRNGVLKRNILEFSLSPNPLVEQDFTIEETPRVYTEEYLELTKMFHIFNSL